jgi:hypothetical protein
MSVERPSRLKVAGTSTIFIPINFALITISDANSILGSVLIVIGFLLFLYVFSIWESANFGPIDIPKVTPIVIGSSISLSLGFEIILSSFLLSMLKLNVRATSTMLVTNGEFESDILSVMDAVPT